MDAHEITRAALRDFYDDCAAALDAEDLDAFPGFFVEDATYRVISRENVDQGLAHAPIYCRGRAMIEDRIMATTRAALYQPRSLRHFISGVRVTGSDGDAVRSEANFLIIESLIEQEPQILMVGRYVDLIVREGADLRFRKHDAIYDNYSVRTTLVIPA